MAEPYLDKSSQDHDEGIGLYGYSSMFSSS